VHTHHHHENGTHGPHRRLLAALVLTLSFALIEAVAGWWSGSLALLSDADHMLTDSLALGLAALAPSWRGADRLHVTLQPEPREQRVAVVSVNPHQSGD
jgi:Co/Zn/Cd efflux system component